MDFEKFEQITLLIGRCFLAGLGMGTLVYGIAYLFANTPFNSSPNFHALSAIMLGLISLFIALKINRRDYRRM
ncbi:hypothetical protein [Thalassotalea fusca]